MISKFHSASSTFKCQGSTVAVLVCEYLFTLVKVKDDQSFLKNCQKINIFEPRFFVIIYINYHDTAW